MTYSQNTVVKAAVGVGLVVAGLLTGCGTKPEASPPPVATAPKVTRGTLTAAAQAKAETLAFAYDPALAPAGATTEVTLTPLGDKTTVRLSVTGFVPSRAYGAHLHVKACGADPKAAGGHFQHHVDPQATQSPSVDPAYANAANEVWLDFTTDAAGAATATATAAWPLSGDKVPASLVVHAETTKTEAGKAGTAGARVGCMTLKY